MSGAKARQENPRRLSKVVTRTRVKSAIAALRKRGCDVVFVLPQSEEEVQIVYQSYKRAYRVRKFEASKPGQLRNNGGNQVST